MIRFASLIPPVLSPVRRGAGALLLGAALLASSSAMAAPPQAADDEEGPASVSHPVVEPTAPSAGKALNAALGRLAKDPRNVDALLEAGNAALALGDNEAALGFFTRADQISSANATVKAAIAGARLHLDDPVEALRWYADAEKTGADPSAFALDRGLAFDLVGDNAAAIAQYRLVLAHSSDPALHDEATRREALSLAIGGDRRGADLALLPLLQRQDRAAWRVHIFVLAIAGRADDAVTVAHATMPPELAEAIAPYLRFMARLTPAQQAAVASLGRFPRAADVGRDDPRVVAYSTAHPRVPLVPTGAPALAQAAPPAADAKSARARRRHGQNAASDIAAVARPNPEPEIALPAPPPPPVMATPVTGRAATGHAPALAASAAPPVAPIASRTTTSHPAGFDLAQVTGSAPAPRTATTTAPATTGASTVPQPTVLSRLDMPPQPRRTPVQTATASAPPVATPPVAVVPAPVSVPVPAPSIPVAAAPAAVVVSPQPQAAAASPTPVAAASAPQAAAGIIAVPVPASTVAAPPSSETPAMTQHAVVQPVRVAAAAPPHAKPAPPAHDDAVVSAPTTPAKAKDKVGPEKVGRDKSGKDKSAKDEAVSTKAAKDSKGRTKAGKDKPTEDTGAADDTSAKDMGTAKDRGTAKGKAAKGKGSVKEADSAPVPCKPATPTKGRKGKAESTSSAKSKSAHGAKGKKHAVDDSETCVATAHGDRPDGPGDVSRDTDSEDSRAAKSRDKDKAKGKNHDKDNAKDSEKGGRKAHYASRIWVQVLTGGDRDKMPGEWRALVRKAHALKGHKPYLTPWHSNFRLLTGPFDSDADAQDYIADLRKDGVSGFEWTSPAGQAVDGLPLP